MHITHAELLLLTLAASSQVQQLEGLHLQANYIWMLGYQLRYEKLIAVVKI